MKKTKENKSYGHLFYLLFCIVIVLIGKSFIGDAIKKPFSYIFTPIYISGNSIGQRIVDWKSIIIDASSYIREYKEMKEDIEKLKVENSEKLIDYEEYLSLKEQISVSKNDNSYVLAKVLDYTDTGEMLINIGEKEGVKKGDNVVLGKVYLGTVSSTSLETSLVRLPINVSSSFEIVVIPSSVDLNGTSRVDGIIKSTGVVIGSVDGIVVENMGINSNVSDGDYVLIRDSRIGDVLTLGTLVGVSKNPASTHKSGYVSPILDYYNLITVFVKIEK